MLVRHADPRLDAAACAAILAPSENEAEMRHRIAAVVATHCWLVAEDASGAVVGFAYATPHRGRVAQRSAAETEAFFADARGNQQAQARQRMQAAQTATRQLAQSQPAAAPAAPNTQATTATARNIFQRGTAAAIGAPAPPIVTPKSTGAERRKAIMP